jgi:F-type H+-transporting ATPase subunit b
MLKRLANAELTAQIVAVSVEDLRVLPAARCKMLQDAVRASPSDMAIEVVSAHPLGDQSRDLLTTALSQTAKITLQPEFSVNPELYAGVRITMGEYVLYANLADDLTFFEEHDPHA